MPSVVNDMDPKWKTCAGYVLGWKDPPKAMPQTDNIALPRVTASATSKKVQEGASELEQKTAEPGFTAPQTAKATPMPLIGLQTDYTNEWHDGTIHDSSSHKSSARPGRPGTSNNPLDTTGNRESNGAILSQSKPSTRVRPNATLTKKANLLPGQGQ